MDDGEALGRAWKILNDALPAKAEEQPEHDRPLEQNADKSKKCGIADKTKAQDNSIPEKSLVNRKFEQVVGIQYQEGKDQPGKHHQNS